MSDPRLVWALFYMFVNTAALVYGLVTGELMGDGAGFFITHSGRFIMAFALLMSAILVLRLLYTALCRLQMPFHAIRSDDRVLSVVLLSIVLFFIVYVSATGLFVAGSAERGGTALSALFVFWNVDLLFFLYYARCRSAPLFKIVALCWLMSVIQRGWFGYIFVLIALESMRLIRRRELKLSWVIFGILLIMIYPFIDAFKVLIRLNPDVNIFEILGLVPDAVSSDSTVISETLIYVFEKVVGRVQVLAHAFMTVNNQQYFTIAAEHGNIGSFWKEGFFGLIGDKLFGLERLPESSQLLATFIVPDNDSAWNVNPSLVGWFYIYADALPFTLLYVLLLCVASFALMKRIADTRHSRDVLWFYWLIFLVPGWISQFNSLLATMLLFIALIATVNLMRVVLQFATLRRLALSEKPV